MKKLSLAAIMVSTREYEGSHGRKPRGFGHWAFWMGRDTSDIDKAMWFSGMYTDAVRQAKQKAQELGVSVITVGS